MQEIFMADTQTKAGAAMSSTGTKISETSTHDGSHTHARESTHFSGIEPPAFEGRTWIGPKLPDGSVPGQPEIQSDREEDQLEIKKLHEKYPIWAAAMDKAKTSQEALRTSMKQLEMTLVVSEKRLRINPAAAVAAHEEPSSSQSPSLQSSSKKPLTRRRVQQFLGEKRRELLSKAVYTADRGVGEVQQSWKEEELERLMTDLQNLSTDEQQYQALWIIFGESPEDHFGDEVCFQDLDIEKLWNLDQFLRECRKEFTADV